MSGFVIFIGVWVLYAYVQTVANLNQRRSRFQELDNKGVPFNLLDMLMPAKLLARTNWRDNPLMVYTLRRSRRFWRFLLTRVMELVLIAMGTMLAASAFFWIATTRMFPSSDWIKVLPANHENDLMFSIAVVGKTTPYFYFLFTFILIRYHLLINDQSGHIKNLSRERLAELLLTHLGSEEYFLHHFLMFCRRYRVIIAWAAIWAALIGYDVLHGGITWVQPISYSWLILTLFLVLAVWIAGIFQYVLEWNWFAGGRARRWRILPSLGISLVIAWVVLRMTMLVFAKNFLMISYHLQYLYLNSASTGSWILSSHLMPGGITDIAKSIFWLGLALVFTFLFGRHVYRSATYTLKIRYDPDRKDFTIAQEILRYR